MTQSGAWTWVKPTFTAAVAERARANYFGFRQFPHSDCTAGNVLALATDNGDNISEAISDPTVSASTPIAAALNGLASSFGDPNDGQAVVLITDGEETCGTQTEAIQAASALFRAGVKVYVVAVTTTANRSLLDQLAQVGGTGASILVKDASEFSAALETIYGEVGARRCDPSNLCCEADGCALADPAVVCAFYAATCAAAACDEATGACYRDTAAKDGVSCDDGVLCSYNDTCQGGVCKGQAVTCTNDSTICGATRRCNGTAQCTAVYADLTVACATDGLACTSDHCDGQGSCAHERVSDKCLIGGVCYDNHAVNPANTCQWCDAATNAWVNKPTTESCDDGNFCTYGDHCSNGACVGTAVACNSDSGVCGAKRTCNGTAYCTVVYAGPSTSCDDGDLCTYSDHCNKAGACVGTTVSCTDSDSSVCGLNHTCNGTASCSQTYPTATTLCLPTAEHAVEGACNGAGSCLPTRCDSDYFISDVQNDRCSLAMSSVSAGYGHSCTLATTGAVYCWGLNSVGQLGDGTTESRVIPGEVSGLTSKITAISAGYVHTCALTDAGAVYCWGWNFYGQLGNGTTEDSATPSAVNGLTSGVIALATGKYHTCALTNSGAVYCWGINRYGQLGVKTTSEYCGSSGAPYPCSTSPIAAVELASGVMAISANDQHTCVLLSTGGVVCWGMNYYGELGDGSQANSSTPVSVSTLTNGIAVISAGNGSSCAATDKGVIYCWGLNTSGQLGNGTTSNSTTPVSVKLTLASGAIIGITEGDYHTCAVADFGLAYCWGLNTSGQLGDGSTTLRVWPKTVTVLARSVATIAAGGDHTCALTNIGATYCWGNNAYGQLGNGTTTNAEFPTGVVW